MPWNAISNVTTLKALRMVHMRSIYNSPITDSICKLSELNFIRLSYIDFTNINGDPSNDVFIPECIGLDWKNLRHLGFGYISSLTYFPPLIFNLPNIHSIYLVAFGN